MNEQVEQTSAEMENKHHRYRGNDIPWYVRLIWIGFWIFAVAYALQFMFPAIRTELFNQP